MEFDLLYIYIYIYILRIYGIYHYIIVLTGGPGRRATGLPSKNNMTSEISGKMETHFVNSNRDFVRFEGIYT